MTSHLQRSESYTIRIVAMIVVLLTTASVHAGGSCCSSKSGDTDSAAAPDCHSGQQAVQRRNTPVFQTPHGGQLAKEIWHDFEVVYGPHETRVYLYDMFHSPVSAQGIEGWAIMRVRSTESEYRFPAEYVPVSDRQDYLAVRVDLTRVHDGDMDVRFELIGLPSREEPTAKFAQVFSMTRRPVSGGNNQIVSLPRTNELAREPAKVKDQHPSPRIAVTEATEADNAAVRAQTACPVMNQRLGSHGRPIKIVIDGRSLFVCCMGCVSSVSDNPSLYFAKTNG